MAIPHRTKSALPLRSSLSILIAITALSHPSFAEVQPIINDESDVPTYVLPPLLQDTDGNPVSTPEEWRANRARLIEIFEDEFYGRMPSVPFAMTAGTIADTQRTVGPIDARLLQVRLKLENPNGAASLDLLILLPESSEPVPAFMGLNFFGNHTIADWPEIWIPESWTRNNAEFGITENRPTAKSRGKRAHRWPVEHLLRNGFGLITIYYGDIDPDFDDGFKNGVHALLPTDFPRDKQSSISAWAWGLSRALDYVAGHIPAVNPEKVALIGHSRLGKAALWAGAKDERFALVVSNDSGCAGAALYRRRFGERLEQMTTAAPHWLIPAARNYREKEDQLAVDQHQLLALTAPRPLYVASASEDLWADPFGEFLALKEAQPVYQLLAGKGFPEAEFPRPGEALIGHTAYHLREGQHDLTSWDWLHFVLFAKRHFQKD